MTESNMRRTVTGILKPLHGIAVENPAYPGTPDVSYVGGWIELKFRDRWPHRVDSIVRCEHYTNEQRIWHRKRWEKGGTVFVLLQVGPEYLLFNGPTAAKLVGKTPETTLRAWALDFFISKKDLEERLISALDEHRNR